MSSGSADATVGQRAGCAVRETHTTVKAGARARPRKARSGGGEGGRNRAKARSRGSSSREGSTVPASAVPCGRIPFHHVCYPLLIRLVGWLLAKVLLYIPPRKWLSEIRTSDSLTCFAPKTNKTRRGEARVSFIANDACVLHGCLFIREAALQCGLTCR
jgi:hypothetical protein